MNNSFVSFDAMKQRVVDMLKSETIPAEITPIYLVRDLFGKVRISVSGESQEDRTLQRIAVCLCETLGKHGYPADDAVLFVDDAMMHTLKDAAQEILPGVYWADRLVTGRDWWTVGDSDLQRTPMRYTLFSVKGGVGRSTTAAVLAWHLVRRGERVLVVDLDLESPGLSSAMLAHQEQPKFGVTDWFVEDLVGQGEYAVEQMIATPAWAQDFEGDVYVVPAHGSELGEYLAKLGRVYMDTPNEPWTARIERLLNALETYCNPTVVLLESRSGLHDIAATTVTHLNAEVLLFTIDSESNWTDYNILFRHWQTHGLAAKIRERLSIVSALTPEIDTEQYLRRFQERAWDLFRDNLYDRVDPSNESGAEFSFALDAEPAPHNPLPIHWTRGLAAGASLRNLETTTVEQAYAEFLRRFDQCLTRAPNVGSSAPSLKWSNRAR